MTRHLFDFFTLTGGDEIFFDNDKQHIRLFLQIQFLNIIEYNNGMMPDQLKVMVWQYLAYFYTDSKDPTTRNKAFLVIFYLTHHRRCIINPNKTSTVTHNYLLITLTTCFDPSYRSSPGHNAYKWNILSC